MQLSAWEVEYKSNGNFLSLVGKVYRQLQVLTSSGKRSSSYIYIHESFFSLTQVYSTKIYQKKYIYLFNCIFQSGLTTSYKIICTHSKIFCKFKKSLFFKCQLNIFFWKSAILYINALNKTWIKLCLSEIHFYHCFQFI